MSFIKEEGPMLIFTLYGVVGFVLLIVYAVRVIKRQYRQGFVENKQFGRRAQRIVGKKVGVVRQTRVVDENYEEHVRKVHENYYMAVYEYVIDGVTYQAYYEEYDGRERPDQHEFLYEAGKPEKVYWAEDAFSLRGKNVQRGCLLSVLAGVVYLVILCALGTAFGFV